MYFNTHTTTTTAKSEAKNKEVGGGDVQHCCGTELLLLFRSERLSGYTVTVDLIIMFMSKSHLTLATACEKETCGNSYVHHLSCCV